MSWFSEIGNSSPNSPKLLVFDWTVALAVLGLVIWAIQCVVNRCRAQAGGGSGASTGDTASELPVEDAYERALGVPQTRANTDRRNNPLSDVRRAVNKVRGQLPKSKAQAKPKAGPASPKGCGKGGKAPFPQVNTVEGNYGAIQDVATPVGESI